MPYSVYTLFSVPVQWCVEKSGKHEKKWETERHIVEVSITGCVRHARARVCVEKRKRNRLQHSLNVYQLELIVFFLLSCAIHFYCNSFVRSF